MPFFFPPQCLCQGVSETILLSFYDYNQAVAPLTARDPKVFMEAASKVIELVKVNGRGPFVRLKPPASAKGGGEEKNTSTAITPVKAGKNQGIVIKKGGGGGGAVGVGKGAGGSNTTQMILSLLLSKMVDLLAKGPVVEEQKEEAVNEKAVMKKEDDDMLSLSDVMELLGGLAMSLPHVALGLVRYNMGELIKTAKICSLLAGVPALDSIIRLMVYTLIPVERGNVL